MRDKDTSKNENQCNVVEFQLFIDFTLTIMNRVFENEESHQIFVRNLALFLPQATFKHVVTH